MQNKLLSEICNFNFDISIIVKDLSNDKVIINYNGDKKVISASIIKVIILLASFKALNEGKIELLDKISTKTEENTEFSTIIDEGLTSYTIDELLNWMIITSDNGATNLLIDVLGIEYINDISKKFDLKATLLERKMLDYAAIKNGKNNYTSNQDMLKIMECIYRKKYISTQISEKIMGILLKQRDNNRLTRYICDDIKVAHKSGELDTVSHDMGIFYLNNIDYYIGIFITNVNDCEEANRCIGKLSKIVYKYLSNNYI